MSTTALLEQSATSIWRPSLGNATDAIAKRLATTHQDWSPIAGENWETAQGEDSLEMALFESLARASTWVAQLSMHLPDDWRNNILLQLQRLLNKNDWDDDSNLLNPESVRSFLRFIIYGNVVRSPQLGINNKRQLTATWIWPDRRIFMDFSSIDACRGVFSAPGKFGTIRQAFAANVGDAVGTLLNNGFDLSQD